MLVALLLVLALGLPAPQASVSLPPFTLAAAVAQAKARSPFRASARSLAEGTALSASLAGRPPNPLFEVRTENLGHDRTALPLDVFITATQMIELGGKRAARMELSAAQRDVAAAQLSLTDRQIALRTVQLYLQALRAKGHVATLRANRDGLTDLIAAVRRRVEEGYSAESDLLRFQTEAARIDIESARATLELDRSLATLAVVVGSTGPLDASQILEPEAVPPPPLDAAGLAAALERHPEVVAAVARQSGARQLNGLERAKRVPDPIVTGGYKRTAGINTAVVAVTMTVGLFDRNEAAIARTRGEEEAAAGEHDAVVRRLTADTTLLVDAARSLAARASRASAELIAPAEVVRTAARAAFREGVTDVLKLIDAERVYVDVQRTALELRLEALSTAFEARLALGEEVLP